MPLAASLSLLRNFGSLKKDTSAQAELDLMSLYRSAESVGEPSSSNLGTAMNLRDVVGGRLRTSTSESSSASLFVSYSHHLFLSCVSSSSPPLPLAISFS